jgi:hypothetical protein
MKSSSKRVLGIVLIVGPIIGLPLVLAGYAISSFVIQSMAAANPAGHVEAELAGGMVSALLGLLGVLCVAGIFIGIPLGIYLLVQASKEKNLSAGARVMDPRSGMGDASPVPPEIQGWSWGGFGLGWIWGICNNVWLSLFQFVGPLALPIGIYLGVKGRELAWKHKVWESVEVFQRTQKKWDTWGLVLFLIGAVCAGLMFVLLAATAMMSR